MNMAVKGFRRKYPEFDAIPVVPVSTPDYSGCLETGFAKAVEAVIKTLFLERTQFRCVVIDSTKIHLGLGSAATFAPWSPDAVDLLIADRGAMRLPADVRQELLNSGVDVLLAHPTEIPL